MKKTKLMITVLMVAFIGMLCPIEIIALSHSNLESQYSCDATTGWKHSPAKNHMDSPNTSYYIYSEALRAKYKGYFENGVQSWGGNISVNYTSTGMGYITEETDTSEYWLARVTSAGNSNGITSSWTLRVNTANFEDMTAYAKNKIMAHELGHVYGLGDIEYSTEYSSIMYHQYSNLMAVRAKDIIGMQVMTGAHRHIGTYSKTYEMVSSTNHKVRCSVCKSFNYENHTSVDNCTKCGFSRC